MTRRAAVLLVLLAAGGCGGGDGLGRLPVSGTVTLDGQPRPGGYVVFEPKAGQPTQSGGAIVAGRFDIPREAGAAPGRYAVAVFSGSDAPDAVATAGTPAADARAAKTGERVPRRYNVDTTLTADVTADGPNEFRFDLVTPAKP